MLSLPQNFVIFSAMKSQDLQLVVKAKAASGQSPKKIFDYLMGVVSVRTIERWVPSVRLTGEINLTTSPGRPRSARSKVNINKIKKAVHKSAKQSSRRMAKTLQIHRSSVHRALKSDLGLVPYKYRKEPKLTPAHLEKRIKFAKWVRKFCSNASSQTAVFCDEKLFDLDGVYNHQNDRVWATTRVDADNLGAVFKKQKFPKKVMVWLAVGANMHSRPIFFIDESVDHDLYIKKALPEALRFGNATFGSNWTFVQDGATPHTHELTQEWGEDKLPAFIPKSLWPPNSPDLNPLDFCVWNELVQAMDWSHVVSQSTLVKEITRGCGKLKGETVLRSCQSWRKRVLDILRSAGAYVQ